MNIIDALNWRYAVRKFSDEQLAENQVQQLLTATRLTATSYGLQPYRLIMVNNLAVREQLLEHAYGQDKVVNCSHLLVFAVKTEIGDLMIDHYIKSVAHTRGISIYELDGLSKHMKSVFNKMAKREKREWAHQQAYIALGTLLTSAATMKIDSCPMGGFDNEGFNRVLGLSDMGLETSVICALGIRHPDDSNADLQKVRYGEEEMVVVV